MAGCMAHCALFIRNNGLSRGKERLGLCNVLAGRWSRRIGDGGLTLELCPSCRTLVDLEEELCGDCGVVLEEELDEDGVEGALVPRFPDWLYP